jgi:drug/metabolite transporter (DMT)-like permease
VTAVIGGSIAALFFTGAILSSTRATRIAGPVATLAGVMLVSAIVSAPIVFLTTVGTPFPSDALIWLFLAGAGNVGGLLSEYIGLRTGKVGVVGALAAAEGAVAAALSVLAGEILGPVAAAGVAVVGLGVVLTAFSPDPVDIESTGRRTRSAVVFGSIAGLAFGFSLYATARLGATLPIGWALAPPRVIGVLAITLPAIATRRFRVPPPARKFIVAGGVCEVGGFLAVALSAADGIAVTSALAAQFASLAAIVAWLRFGERLSRRQWVGVAAVAVGVVLLAFGAT